MDLDSPEVDTVVKRDSKRIESDTPPGIEEIMIEVTGYPIKYDVRYGYRDLDQKFIELDRRKYGRGDLPPTWHY